MQMEGIQVARVEDGEDVFRGLVEEHSRMVFRLAYRLTGNEQDAEDVVQETFLKVHRHFSRFDVRASFSTWVHRIAANCAIDLLRRKSRRMGWGGSDGVIEAESLPSDRPGPDAKVRSREVKARVAEALDALSPSERTAFVLRHFEGHTTEEVARALGVSANAAKQTVFRAVHKLRLLLAPLVEETP
jgi:RNA polymerase sigma-70 factor (ECF subfamily)